MSGSPLKGVYFIQGDPGSPIKIGFASDCARRLVTLQGATPVRLRILATIACRKEVEGALHEKFAMFHIGGEWFRETPALLAEIVSAQANPEYLARIYSETGLQLLAAESAGAERLPQYEMAIIAQMRLWLRELSLPCCATDTVATRRDRAIALSGLSPAKGMRIWYGQRASLLASEYLLVRDAIDARRNPAVANMANNQTA